MKSRIFPYFLTILHMKIKNCGPDASVRGGVVGIGAQALILHPDGAQRVLSSPAKPFYVMLVFNFFVQHEVW